MRLYAIIPLLFFAINMFGWHSVNNNSIKGLQVILNNDFEALPILKLGSNDCVQIGFDELSHNYRRFICHIEPCNPDGTPVEGLFDSDWLVGFNDIPIEQYENSLNTTTLYTHYEFRFPNEHANVCISGNYKLHILDEDSNEEVAIVEIRVVEPIITISIGMTTDTDIAFQDRYQQINMTVGLNSLRVTDYEEQLQTFVLQNGREDNMKCNVPPTSINMQTLKWEHNRLLIFDAGNEYRKFEMLDPHNLSMGLEAMYWNPNEKSWNAYPTECLPRRSYIYDEDANGAFLYRNSDNFEWQRTSEYINVHYCLKNVRHYEDADVVVKEDAKVTSRIDVLHLQWRNDDVLHVF